ncbi:MAG: DEAD/DEAH box helicase [Oligoflexia bacterium]|nr:DEAD/DEAH box helicase [Oligoflexia bacterium]
MQTFHDLSLSHSLERSLAAMEFKIPTPIQAQGIPVALARKDLIACAQTGTGKTAAFCIPIIERLLKEPARTALILAPTRELAAQILEVLTKLTAHNRELRGALLIGGASMQPQLRALRQKPRVVIATPGRLIDHLRQRSVSLAQVELLVLDEADRMLDMGFAPQLDQILRHLPRERQTLLYSATLPDDILRLAAKFLRDPVRVTVGPVSKPVQKIAQSVIETTAPKKNEALLDQINVRQGSMLIFARTKSRTDRLAKYLTSYGLPVGRIHGGRSQGQRNSALAGFRDGTFRILVATDIAARGIDISHIAHVINYDLPQVPEDYVHRIGRTARAGATGEAVSLLTPEDRAQWRAITKLVARK